MIDGINNAHGITPQADKTLKKQGQAAQKDSASIFSYKGSEKVTGTVTGTGTVNIPHTSQVWENGILVSESEGTTPKRVEVDYGRIDTAALEGGEKKLLDE